MSGRRDRQSMPVDHDEEAWMSGSIGQFLSAVRAGEIGVGVWGCGHIGASALFHLAMAGVRCVGYDVAPERVRAIREGRFLSTAVTHPTPPDVTPDTASVPLNILAFGDWHELIGRNLRLHLICVPTDQGPNPSSTALEDVAPKVCAVIREDLAQSRDAAQWPHLLIVESTIVPS